MSIGIVTAVLSISDIFLHGRFSANDEFEFWRAHCIQNIEQGGIDVEFAQWKLELERIDKKAKLARTKARHQQRAQDTFEEFPAYLKHAICVCQIIQAEKRVERNLKDAGVIW